MANSNSDSASESNPEKCVVKKKKTGRYKSIEGGELLKVVSFVFSIPVSNSSCERTFSVMNSLWTIRKKSSWTCSFAS